MTRYRVTADRRVEPTDLAEFLGRAEIRAWPDRASVSAVVDTHREAVGIAHELPVAGWRVTLEPVTNPAAPHS